MAKHSFSSDSDQHDPKIFRESLGSFGTTTQPGADQLKELQTKIRQGVKHVELHLASESKGNFGQQDVPDKYGFEQRRTIMQLAKLNNQTLSVHGTFGITSFTGLGQGGFNESNRWKSIKEIDETLSFAAQTATQGAVVFHIQGDGISTTKGELNFSKEYLVWLKENKPDEYKNLEKIFFTANPLDRQYVDNPQKPFEIKKEYENLSSTKKEEIEKLRKLKYSKYDSWEVYNIKKNLDKLKLSPEMSPLIVVGDKISQVQRSQDLVDINIIRNKDNFDSKEQNLLKKIGIHQEMFGVEDFQKAQAIFSNGLPSELRKDISEEEFEALKNKVLVTYEDVLEKEDFLQAQADKTFQKKIIDINIALADLQKEDLETTYLSKQNYVSEIEELKRRKRELVFQLKEAQLKGDSEKVSKIREELNGELPKSLVDEFQEIIEKSQSGNLTQQEQIRAQELQNKINSSQSNSITAREYRLIMSSEVGQVDYQKLEKYSELKSQYEEQKASLIEQKENIKAITDEVFTKNTSAMGHLGIKALKYQLEMKQNSTTAKEKLKESNQKIKKLENDFQNSNSQNEKNKLINEIQKEKYKQKKLVGLSDYSHIDLVEKPLYLAPENMIPDYGNLTTIEEFKAVVRMSQNDFASKILSEENDYKKIREDYEKVTGIKIDSKEKALELAKRHIGGTFDNAHAAVWQKHFRKEEGESDEHHMDRFNKWLNDQAVEMYKEGIVKHVHFNDTQMKDDDHNLLGQGKLDIFDLRERLRGAGFKEALIVEAGGRGANSVLHLQNAFSIFNPSLFGDPTSLGGTGYKLPSGEIQRQANVSDWISVQRNYENRPQYSSYGMGYSTFKHSGPPQGFPRGSWSGTGFL